MANGKKYTLKSKAIKRIVKNVLAANVETKAVQGSASGTASTAGNIFEISNMGTGDTLSLRTGLKIKAKSLEVRNTSIVSSGTNSTRIVWFYDTLCDGSAPGISDVFVTGSYNSPYNYINQSNGRFKILYDTHHDMNLAGQGFKTSEKKRKLSFDIHYLDSGSTVSSCSKNNIFCLIIAQANTTCSFRLDYTLEFTDA